MDNLLGTDPYMLLADYRSYIDCQDEVGRAWGSPERWTRASKASIVGTAPFNLS